MRMISYKAKWLVCFCVKGWFASHFLYEERWSPQTINTSWRSLIVWEDVSHRGQIELMLLSYLISPPTTVEAVSTIHSPKFKDTHGTKKNILDTILLFRHHCFSINILSKERLVNDGKRRSFKRIGSESYFFMWRTSDFHVASSSRQGRVLMKRAECVARWG